MSRILVIAPHPDDEVLGVGGTIAKMTASGAEVWVVIVTMASPPLYSPEVLKVSRSEACEAHRFLGVTETRFLTFPAAGLDTVPHADLNAELARVFLDCKPTTVFVPFGGDIHMDHQRVFHSAIVCSRPLHTDGPRAVYAYETLSETNWNAPYLTPAFSPTVFVDISDHIGTKLDAMRMYASQLRPSPNERSLSAIEALAMFRGSTIGVRAAEAFVLVREIR